MTCNAADSRPSTSSPGFGSGTGTPGGLGPHDGWAPGALGRLPRVSGGEAGTLGVASSDGSAAHARQAGGGSAFAQLLRLSPGGSVGSTNGAASEKGGEWGAQHRGPARAARDDAGEAGAAPTRHRETAPPATARAGDGAELSLASALAPPSISPIGVPSERAAEARALITLEDLVPALVRKVAWSNEGHRGTVRLELGAGALAGATLLVRAEEGRVRVHFNVPPGVDMDAWRTRIARRLAGRGLLVDDIEVE